MEAVKKGIVNFMLNGVSGWGTESPDTILGAPAEKISLADVKQLSRSRLLKLFHAIDAPEFVAMKGEYKAEVLQKGPFARVADFYTHHVFGPGRWTGKAFYPLMDTSGWGYNIFSVKQSKNAGGLARTCRMNTCLGPSGMDNKLSFCLDYSPWNGFLNYTMRDEIRQINTRLFLGMGYMYAGGGPVNPAPFVLHGEPSGWVGPDGE